MSEVNTTSINELPTDPSVGGNINLFIKENVDPSFNCLITALFTSGSAYPSIIG